MWGKIIGIILIIFIIGGFVVPVGPIGQTADSSIAVTYGETTYANQDYKDIVNQYFKDNGYNNLDNANKTIITANDVNAISQDISHKTYNSNQILSSALVDLNSNNDIKVDVDKSKITTVTESMYKTALNSSGITKGHVIVTSPTTATGESALAGILKSYEVATGKEIPNDVKEAANNEIYTQSEVVNNTNISADDVANVVSQAKEEAAKQNTTDTQTIINIVNNIASNNNINITSTDASNLADSISQSQSVQDKANQYQNQVTDYVNSEGAQTLFSQIWNMIQSMVKWKYWKYNKYFQLILFFIIYSHKTIPFRTRI